LRWGWRRVRPCIGRAPRRGSRSTRRLAAGSGRVASQAAVSYGAVELVWRAGGDGQSCMTQNTVTTVASPQPPRPHGLASFSACSRSVAARSRYFRRSWHRRCRCSNAICTPRRRASRGFYLVPCSQGRSRLRSPVGSGDMFGRKRVLVISLSTLAASSLVAAVATSLKSLLVDDAEDGCEELLRWEIEAVGLIHRECDGCPAVRTS
jgi:hypothetical protein